MDNIVAHNILSRVFTNEFKDFVSDVLKEGLDIYSDANIFTNRISAWMRTNVESRLLTASILTAVEQADWERYGYTRNKEKQHSTHRISIKSNDSSLLIDFIKSGEHKRKFIEERCMLNLAEGETGLHYCVISYELSSDKTRYVEIKALIPSSAETASMEPFGFLSWVPQ